MTVYATGDSVNSMWGDKHEKENVLKRISELIKNFHSVFSTVLCYHYITLNWSHCKKLSASQEPRSRQNNN